MMLKNTGLTALLFLFACDNGGGPGNGGNTGDSGGGNNDTTSESTYAFEVDALIEGSSVDATVYVDGNAVGSAGECLGLDNYYGGDPVTVTVGTDGAGETKDGLPLVKDPNGDKWVAPSADVTPSSTERGTACTSQDVNLNFYAGETDEWTCACPDMWDGDSSPFTLKYTDGHTLNFGFGGGELNGKSISYDNGVDTLTANFKSNKLIEGTVDGYAFSCSSN